MHVKNSVSARMSLVRLVQYSLVLFNYIFPFYWTNKWWWWCWWWWKYSQPFPSGCYVEKDWNIAIFFSLHLRNVVDSADNASVWDRVNCARQSYNNARERHDIGDSETLRDGQVHYSELIRTLAKRTEHIHTRLLRHMLDNHSEFLRNLSAEYEAIAEKLLAAAVDTADLMELIGSVLKITTSTPVGVDPLSRPG